MWRSGSDDCFFFSETIIENDQLSIRSNEPQVKFLTKKLVNAHSFHRRNGPEAHILE